MFTISPVVGLSPVLMLVGGLMRVPSTFSLFILVVGCLDPGGGNVILLGGGGSAFGRFLGHFGLKSLSESEEREE